MFLMNTSQRQDQINKAHRHKIINDLFKVAGMVVTLKVVSHLVMSRSS